MGGEPVVPGAALVGPRFLISVDLLVVFRRDVRFLVDAHIAVLVAGEDQAVPDGHRLRLEHRTVIVAVADAGEIFHVRKREDMDQRLLFGHIEPFVRRHDRVDLAREVLFRIVELPGLDGRQRAFVFLRVENQAVARRADVSHEKRVAALGHRIGVEIGRGFEPQRFVVYGLQCFVVVVPIAGVVQIAQVVDVGDGRPFGAAHAGQGACQQKRI